MKKFIFDHELLITSSSIYIYALTVSEEWIDSLMAQTGWKVVAYVRLLDRFATRAAQL